MLLGIGTDIMRIGRLRPESLREEDPFFLRSFSPGEIRQGRGRKDRQAYFAARFAGKEALFKALRISPEKVAFCEMEILNDGNGAPTVCFSGRLRSLMESKSARAHISLSYEDEYVAAFAVIEADKE